MRERDPSLFDAVVDIAMLLSRNMSGLQVHTLATRRSYSKFGVVGTAKFQITCCSMRYIYHVSLVCRLTDLDVD